MRVTPSRTTERSFRSVERMAATVLDPLNG